MVVGWPLFHALYRVAVIGRARVPRTGPVVFVANHVGFLDGPMLPGLALQDRRIRARVVPVDPPLERRVSVAVKPARRAHPAVAAMLEELSATGGVTM